MTEPESEIAKDRKKDSLSPAYSSNIPLKNTETKSPPVER